AGARQCAFRRHHLLGDGAGAGEVDLIFVPKGVHLSHAASRGQIVGDLFAPNVEDDAVATGGQAKSLQDVDIQRKLDCVVELRLAVALAVIAAAFLAPARLDVDGYVAAASAPEQIGDADQVVGCDAAGIDE